jgi:hypothetical protein
MSAAAFTFQIFGRSCVVILPPSLDVAPANDVQATGIGSAQRAQAAQWREPGEAAPQGAYQDAPVPSRPSEVAFRIPAKARDENERA